MCWWARCGSLAVYYAGEQIVSVLWWGWGSKYGPPKSRDRHVWLALANHADNGGACFPSLRFLINETRKSESTVRRALHALEADGWVKITQRGNGRGKRTHYQLVNRVSAGNPLTDQVTTEKGCQTESQWVSDGPGKGVTVTEPPHPHIGVTVSEPSGETVIEEHTPISPSQARGEQKTDSERKGNGFSERDRNRIAFTAAVDAVHDALMRLTPVAFEKRRNFRNGAVEWNEYRFGDLAFESLEESGADRLVLTVSSPDPDATARGLEKYKNRWDKALHKAFGEPVRLSILGNTQHAPLPFEAQHSSDAGELVSLAQIVQSVLSGRPSRVADLIRPQPEPTRNALTAPTSPLSPENHSRTGEAPPPDPQLTSADELAEVLPPGLTPDAYACRVLEEIGWSAPAPKMLCAVTTAIEARAERDGCPHDEAARRLLREARAAAREGPQKWYEWFRKRGRQSEPLM